MKYGSIEFVGKPVSRLVMGVMPLLDMADADAFAMLDAYRTAGGNCIDNSFAYGERAGTLMGAYYKARGTDALIRIDKGNHPSGNDDAGRRVSRADLEQDILGNLSRQGTDFSDMYLLHRDDTRVPAGDVVEWLNEHVAAGRIGAFGGSNWTHGRIAQANAYAKEHELQPMTVSSPNLSLATANEAMWWEALSISSDDEAREWYASHPVAVMSWSAGGGGWFAGVSSSDVVRVYDNAVNRGRRGRLTELAGDKGVTPTQLALAWTLHQPGNIFALIGPGSLEQLEDNLGAVEVKLTGEELSWLEKG